MGHGLRLHSLHMRLEGMLGPCRTPYADMQISGVQAPDKIAFGMHVNVSDKPAGNGMMATPPSGIICPVLSRSPALPPSRIST